MRALDTKLLRDFRRLWAQSLAVALVMACGVATLIIGRGGYLSLLETRAAYYERSAFAHVFADAVRAPKSLLQDIRLIDGVAQVEGRVMSLGLIDIPYFPLPITGQFISLPDEGEQKLNRIVLVQGRLPQAARQTEAVISQTFAKAHALHPGGKFSATIKGRKLHLLVSGIALSPEYIYAIGPGDMMPDDRRFGVVWMREHDIAPLLDMKGAFNSVAAGLLPGARQAAATSKIDTLLKRYGGTRSHGRADQMSHAFLDAELKQLATMSRILPPIFLVVTAALINMILARLIGLEREQIGLLKAIGYNSSAIALHYVKLVLAIAVAGVLIGFLAGTWLGFGLTKLYQSFFHFPYLIFLMPPSLYGIAAATSLFTALAGAAAAVYRAATLPAAVAMQPPSPPVYQRLLNGSRRRVSILSQLTMMALRHIFRWPWRAAITTAGIAVSVALLVSSMFSAGTVDFMLDVTFDQSDRQDATVLLNEVNGQSALAGIRRLPGVIAAEPFRSTWAELSNGHFKKNVAIMGKPPGADISRILDTTLQPLSLPQAGIVLSEALAERLHSGVGDRIHIKLFRERRQETHATVTGIVRSYIGLGAYMDINAMNRMLGESELISGAHLLLDTSQEDTFFVTAKEQPVLSSFALQRISLANFRKTIAENIGIQTMVYTALGAIIAFGVVYNSARIQFSERARELAILRVLGFTEAEVARVIVTEFVIFTGLAIPLGWLAGIGLAYALVLGFQSELYRIPFVITRDTLAKSALVVTTAVAISMLIVRRRVHKLDLISVLKTRD